MTDLLPTINATMNLLSATCLLLGWRAIRRGERERHRRWMISAFIASSLFLVGYLTRMALTGTHRFEGDSFVRTIYLAILISHSILAACVVPLVLRAFYLAWRQRFDAHKRIARWTFPIWLYVSVTGVVIYWMLYHLN